MNCKRIGSLLLAALVLSVAGCKPAQKGAAAVSVRLKWLHQAQFAGFYTADRKGYYRDADLNVQINPGGSDFPAIQMVVGGGEQFGVTGADQILLARKQGVPVVAIAVIYRETPFVLFAEKKSGIRTPSDMVGKPVGVKLGGNEELTYRALMKKAGVATSRVHEVPVKFDMSPLFAGKVLVWPGYAINEPLVAEEAGHPVNVIAPAQYGLHMYADTLFTTEEMIKSHPDEVKAFVNATLKGWQYSVDHPSEAVGFTLQYDPNLKSDHETKMMLTSIPFLKGNGQPLGLMDRERWSDLQQLLLDQGFLKSPIDINAAFTNQFIDVAK